MANQPTDQPASIGRLRFRDGANQRLYGWWFLATLLLRHHQVLHDVILPLGRVLAHVEGKNLLAVHLADAFHVVPVRKHLKRKRKLASVAAVNTFYRMALTNLAVAEEALSLSPAERADLARLLIESLQDDSRTDDQIKEDLKHRLQALVSGKDPGLTFEEVFGRRL